MGGWHARVAWPALAGQRNCYRSRRLRRHAAPVCTGRRAVRQRWCATQHLWAGHCLLPAPPPDRYLAHGRWSSVTIRVNASQGRPDRASRIGSSSAKAMARLGPVSTLSTGSVTFVGRQPPERSPWRYAAGVGTVARRSGGSPRSKNQGRLRLCGSPPRQSQPARGQSAGAGKLDAPMINAAWISTRTVRRHMSRG